MTFGSTDCSAHVERDFPARPPDAPRPKPAGCGGVAFFTGRRIGVWPDPGFAYTGPFEDITIKGL